MSGSPSDVRISPGLADVCVLLTLIGLVVLYGIDAVRASRSIYNLIFVLPVTALVLLLCGLQFLRERGRPRQPRESKEPVSEVLPAMLLFAAYVLSLKWLGFDAGTLLFVAGFLWMHGERRWPWVLGYSLAFASVLSLFFSTMLPYPMPMLALSTAY